MVLQYGYNGDGGTIFATSGGSFNPKEPIPAPTVALTPEHYNRIARLVQHKIPVNLNLISAPNSSPPTQIHST